MPIPQIKQYYRSDIMSLEDHTPTKTKSYCSCFCTQPITQQQTICSKCLLLTKLPEKEEMPLLSPVTTPKSKVTPAPKEPDFFQEIPLLPLKKEQKDKKRCFNCSKKLGLLGIQCKCGYVFCGGHRLPQNHECDFDFKKIGLQKLRVQLKKVAKGKIEEI